MMKFIKYSFLLTALSILMEIAKALDNNNQDAWANAYAGSVIDIHNTFNLVLLIVPCILLYQGLKKLFTYISTRNNNDCINSR